MEVLQFFTITTKKEKKKGSRVLLTGRLQKSYQKYERENAMLLSGGGRSEFTRYGIRRRRKRGMIICQTRFDQNHQSG